MERHTKTILYIDDDIDDREFLSDALKEVNPTVKVVMAEDGQKALNYLNEAKHTQLPCLIVLDINMPYLDGKQTAQMIKADEALRDIPIIVFTSSESPHDKALFNDYGVEFITKPNKISYMNQIACHFLDCCNQVY